MNPIEHATIAANLEKNFYQYAEKDVGAKVSFDYSVVDMEGNYGPQQTINLKVAAVMEYDTEQTMVNNAGETVQVYGPKVIIFEDDAGNVYAHFNGTGDGKWEQNATNYGGPPSEVQSDSLEFFDNWVAENYEGSLNRGKIYTSGHSQGGNTAGYVTMKSKYGDYIEQCMDMDGPRYSYDAMEDFRNTYGEVHYEQQRGKIYAVHGEMDFVSPLGQQELVPDGHTVYVENTGGNPHSITGMMDGNNLNLLQDDCAPLRKLVVDVNKMVLEKFSPAEQEEVAYLAMKAFEGFMGHSGENLVDPLSPTELERVKELLLPVVVEYIHKNPEMIDAVIDDFVQRGVISQDMATVIKNVVENFNKLPEDQRQDAVEALAKSLVVTEDGTIGFDAHTGGIIHAIFSVGPQILSGALKDPDAVMGMLQEMGVWDSIVSAIQEHPVWATVIAAVVVVAWKPLVALGALAVAVVGAINGAITLFYNIVETLENFAQEVKNFVLGTLAAIRDAIDNAKKFLWSLTPGVAYAAANPYFSADTAKLRSYAQRLRSVNSRLVSLDASLNAVYWEVGMLDILKVLAVDAGTHFSPRLAAAAAYLDYAANALETADNTALSYVGG